MSSFIWDLKEEKSFKSDFFVLVICKCVCVCVLGVIGARDALHVSVSCAHCAKQK